MNFDRFHSINICPRLSLHIYARSLCYDLWLFVSMWMVVTYGATKQESKTQVEATMLISEFVSSLREVVRIVSPRRKQGNGYRGARQCQKPHDAYLPDQIISLYFPHFFCNYHLIVTEGVFSITRCHLSRHRLTVQNKFLKCRYWPSSKPITACLCTTEKQLSSILMWKSSSVTNLIACHLHDSYLNNNLMKRRSMEPLKDWFLI